MEQNQVVLPLMVLILRVIRADVVTEYKTLPKRKKSSNKNGFPMPIKKETSSTLDTHLTLY